LALAKGDVAGARAHRCSSEDEICKTQGVLAAEEAGDKAGATARREQLLKTYERDPVHLIMRSRLASRGTTSQVAAPPSMGNVELSTQN
jgi:hypothetical protein